MGNIVNLLKRRQPKEEYGGKKYIEARFKPINDITTAELAEIFRGFLKVRTMIPEDMADHLKRHFETVSDEKSD